MSILRNGDPYNNPNDRKEYMGQIYELDMIVKSPSSAQRRKEQLEESGHIVIVNPRNAPPEEAMEHLHNRGDPSMNIPTHIDGRTTMVWDIWISTLRRKRRLPRRRVRKLSKPRPKRKLRK